MSNKVPKMYYRKWDSKKSFITKQELESWKLIKQKEINLILHSS